MSADPVIETMAEYTEEVVDSLAPGGELHENVMTPFFEKVSDFTEAELATYDEISEYLPTQELLMDGHLSVLSKGLSASAEEIKDEADVDFETARLALGIGPAIITAYLADTVPLLNWYVAEIFKALPFDELATPELLEAVRPEMDEILGEMFGGEELPPEIMELLERIIEEEHTEV